MVNDLVNNIDKLLQDDLDVVDSSTTSIVCRTILVPQTKKATSFASCATLIDLQVMKTLYKRKNSFTEEWR